MFDAPSNLSQDNWKDQYLQLLSEHEAMQAQHAAETQVMQRCLGRAMYLVHGVEETIDECIAEFQQALKSGEPAQVLSEKVDDLLQIVESKHLVVGPPQARPSSQQPLNEQQGEPLISNVKGELNQASNDVPGDHKMALLKGRVVGILQTIMDQFPEDVVHAEDKSQYLQRLYAGFDWWMLPDLLGDTCRFVIASFQGNQREFETFLVALNDKLQAIHRILEKTSREQSGVLEQHVEMNAMMQRGLTELETSVFEVEDLAQLKSAVKSQLGKISHALGNFHRVQKNNVKFVSDLSLLSARMASVEAEADQLKQTIAKQKSSALTDSLTKLPNRQAYNDQLARELARLERHNTPFCLAVGDVDHFKAINDTFGHLAGDRMLALVAQKLQERLRDSDFIARYGGEEFVILLSGVLIEGASVALEKLREEIEKGGFHYKQQPVSVTISFGVTQVISGDTPQSCFERADHALYQAKDLGRNRVEASRSDLLKKETSDQGD